MRFVLKVFVHYIDEAIAEAPEEKQRADQAKRDDETLTVCVGEY